METDSKNNRGVDQVLHDMHPSIHPVETNLCDGELKLVGEGGVPIQKTEGRRWGGGRISGVGVVW
jgi:hypothetical protein